MKIRIIGTAEECAVAREYYSRLEKQENIQSVSISRLYSCRASGKLYRLYVEIMYSNLESSAIQGKEQNALVTPAILR